MSERTKSRSVGIPLVEPRRKRRKIIQDIEKEHKSRVLVYFCGDRPGMPANIATDAIRPLYDHLFSFARPGEKVSLIDFYIYSLGGRMEVPWRIATMLREFCESLNIIVPYKAYSAATLIALSADNIIMGRKGELSPIDPTLHLIIPEQERPKMGLPPEIGVEDISAYITFIKERAGLTDQDALAESIKVLAEKLTPPVLGQVQRSYSHIRLVSRKLLSLCRPPLEERRMGAIIEALTEKMYLHGHGIGRKEAEEIGLQIKHASAREEELFWKLYLEYENLLKLDSNPDPGSYFAAGQDVYNEPDTAIACIESSKNLHLFRGELKMKKVRKMPQQPTININLGLQMPPGIQANAIPPQIQQAIQQLLQQGAQAIRDQVNAEITRQSPVTGIQSHLSGGKWVKM
jgi:hypothetical protein